MNRAKVKFTRKIHDGSLWLRLAQIIKVEEPVPVENLRRWCKDIPLANLLFTLSEMEQARRVIVHREWKKNRMTEVYTYSE